jgi:hypothetical protein
MWRRLSIFLGQKQRKVVWAKSGFVTWHRPWGRHLPLPSGFGRGYSVRAGTQPNSNLQDW